MNRHPAQLLGALALGALLLQPVTTMADPPAHARKDKSSQPRDYAAHGDQRHWEMQHEHTRRGYVVHRLPSRHRVVHHHGHRYYYSQGLWYRPRGPHYVVVDPPLGLVLSFLPQFGATVYVGGIPHYRAGPVYYVWDPRLRGYVVTEPVHYLW